MRLKGGADDKILYYDFVNRTWDEGNTKEEYDISIKYNDNTEDIAIEVGRKINKLIQDGVMGEGKIERINIDVTTKNGEHKIGRNFKIYWSENNNMITVGCKYDGNCLVQQAKKILREANAAKKEADNARNTLVEAIKDLDNVMKESDAEMYYLRPTQNQNTNTNINETGYAPLTEGMQQLRKQAYTDMEADH